MKAPLLVIAAIVALGILYVMLPVFLDVLMRYRKSRIVTCPRRKQKASVGVDAKEAALTALSGRTKVQINNCTLWKDEMFCNQECLSQL